MFFLSIRIKTDEKVFQAVISDVVMVSVQYESVSRRLTRTIPSNHPKFDEIDRKSTFWHICLPNLIFDQFETMVHKVASEMGFRNYIPSMHTV